MTLKVETYTRVFIETVVVFIMKICVMVEICLVLN